MCKERFPKSYRHPSLDASLTKSRLRAEARCLVRSRRGGVSCPAVLGVDVGTAGTSSCLFLEFVKGCTVRQYLESRSDHQNEFVDEVDGSISTHDKEGAPVQKNPRRDEAGYAGGTVSNETSPGVEKANVKKSTLIDTHSIAVARALGLLVASMHNVNVVHGDLTTSNIIMRNPPSSVKSENNRSTEAWKPSLVLIDFGLAGMAGSKGVNHEEKAVDLYVLERAFESTHPGSDKLVAEILRVYKSKSKSSDSVLQRLSQVRLRGRKRECFG